MWKGWASRRGGLWDQATDSMRKAAKLDPRAVINLIEFGQTLGYVGAWDEALAITRKAYEVNPDSFWAKSYLARMLILTSGDTDTANTLMIGAQHTNDSAFVLNYLEIMIVTSQFEAALLAAKSRRPEWEIDLLEILVNEQFIAEILMLMGKEGEARREAQNALNRLEEIRKQLPGDYRLFRAELRAQAVLGNQQKVLELNQQYLSNKPNDAVMELIYTYSFTQSLALAGMNEQCITKLDYILSGNNATSFKWVELDPYFDNIRNEPEFTAMMERHR